MLNKLLRTVLFLWGICAFYGIGLSAQDFSSKWMFGKENQQELPQYANRAEKILAEINNPKCLLIIYVR